MQLSFFGKQMWSDLSTVVCMADTTTISCFSKAEVDFLFNESLIFNSLSCPKTRTCSQKREFHHSRIGRNVRSRPVATASVKRCKQPVSSPPPPPDSPGHCATVSASLIPYHLHNAGQGCESPTWWFWGYCIAAITNCDYIELTSLHRNGLQTIFTNCKGRVYRGRDISWVKSSVHVFVLKLTPEGRGAEREGVQISKQNTQNLCLYIIEARSWGVLQHSLATKM